MTENKWDRARSTDRAEERRVRRTKRQRTVQRRRSKNKGWGHPLEPFSAVKRRQRTGTAGHNHNRWRYNCEDCGEAFRPGEVRVRGRFGRKVHEHCRDKPVMVAA